MIHSRLVLTKLHCCFMAIRTTLVLVL